MKNYPRCKQQWRSPEKEHVDAMLPSLCALYPVVKTVKWQFLIVWQLFVFFWRYGSIILMSNLITGDGAVWFY